jgi:hypothetical protein
MNGQPTRWPPYPPDWRALHGLYSPFPNNERVTSATNTQNI